MFSRFEDYTYIAFRCLVALCINYILFHNRGELICFGNCFSICWKLWCPACEGVASISGDRRKLCLNFTELSTTQDIKCLRRTICNLCMFSRFEGYTYIAFWRMVTCRINYIFLILNNSIRDRRHRLKIARIASFY